MTTRITATGIFAAILFAAGSCTPVPPLNPVQKAQYHTQLGIRQFRDGNLVRAEKELRDALALYDKDDLAAAYLALVFLQTGRVDKAEQAALKAAALNPSAGRAHYVLGRCALRKGEKDVAAASARQALALSSSPEERDLAEKLLAEILESDDGSGGRARKKDDLTAAKDLFDREEWDAARDILSGYVKEHPRSTAAQERYAMLLLKDGRLAAARSAAQQVLAIDDVSAVATYVFGRCLRLRGDEVNAAPLLARADGLGDPRTRALFEKWNGFTIVPEPEIDSSRVETEPLTIAVFPFLDAQPDSLNAGTAVFRILTTALAGTDAFTVLALSRVETALRERQQEASGPPDPETAVGLGKTLECDAVVVGRISRSGGVLESDARLIEVATGQALAAVSGRFGGAAALDSLAGGLARDLAARAPRKRKEEG